LLTVFGHDDRARLWLGLGAGAIQQYGELFAPYGDPVAFAGAVSLGGTVRIAGGLNLQAGVSSLIYGMNVSYYPGMAPAHGTQVDLAFTTGLSWTFY
jgi:hypothetical protein